MRIRPTILAILLLPTGLLGQGNGTYSNTPPERSVFPRFRFDVGFGLGGLQNEYKRSIDPSQVQDNTPHSPSSFTWPVLHVEGEYALTTETSIGLHYDFWQDERWYKISNDMAVHHNTINTWMVSVRQYWNGHSHAVSIYSGLMMGPSFEHFHQYRITGLPEKDVTRLAMQTTLIGFRFGRGAAASMELGVGNKGLLAMGLSMAF